MEWQGRTEGDYYAVGTHTIKVRAKDIAGAYSEWVSKTFTVVSNKPTVTLTATPTRTVKTASFFVNISTTSNDADGDAITLNGKTKQPTTITLWERIPFVSVPRTAQEHIPNG